MLHPKTCKEFPAAEGWVVVENKKASEIHVVMEPYGIGGSIEPGKQAHIHLMSEGQHPSTIIVDEEIIQIYCADAMYQDGIEVLDVRDWEI